MKLVAATAATDPLPVQVTFTLNGTWTVDKTNVSQDCQGATEHGTVHWASTTVFHIQMDDTGAIHGRALRSTARPAPTATRRRSPTGARGIATSAATSPWRRERPASMLSASPAGGGTLLDARRSAPPG